jgi:hypothetical protein
MAFIIKDLQSRTRPFVPRKRLLAITRKIVTNLGHVRFVHPADYVASFERLLSSLPTCIFADEDDAIYAVSVILLTGTTEDFLDMFGIPDENTAFCVDGGGFIDLESHGHQYPEEIVQVLLAQKIIKISPDATYSIPVGDEDPVTKAVSLCASKNTCCQ